MNYGTGLRLKTILFSLVLLLTPVTSAASESISLQLKWKHAFQFAGFYMAKEKGFYKEAELNVSIIEGGPEQTSVDYILLAEGRYGVADTGALLSRVEGKPIKALAAIFQHSPLALTVREDSGIRDFTDLRGKRIMMQRDNMDAVILAAIIKAGVDKKAFIRQNNSFNMQDLIDGNTDAFSIYITDQPHQLIERRIAHRILNPREYNIDFYGDILITSEIELLEHPERAEAFLKASMQGWSYALEHVDETIELIQSKYNSQQLTTSQLYFEAAETADMILKDVVNPGYMSLHRWQKIAHTYAELDAMPANYPVEQFLYSREPLFTDFIAQYRWQLMIAGLLVLLLFSGLQSTLLRRMVRNRTHALKQSESQFRTLLSNIQGAVFRYRPDQISSIDFISSEIENISGYPASDFINNALSYRSIIHQSDKAHVINTIEQSLKNGSAYSLEYRILKKDSAECWVVESGQPSHESGQSAWIDGCIFDITERKHAERLKTSTSEILEMVASDKNLNQIFQAIVHSYEKRYPGMKASILKVIDGRLHKAAAPNLPEIYNNAIEGLKIGPMVGSCGSAAFNKERTISTDMEYDPRWAPYLELIMPLNLRACWSEPIFNSKSEVVGTFGMYYDHVRTPTPEEIIDIANAAKLTGIAMERDQQLNSLRKLSQAIEQTAEVITITNSDGVIEYVNPAFSIITGYSEEESIGKRPLLFRDESYSVLANEIRNTLAHGESWQGIVTEKRKDGTTYPARLIVSPIRNEAGEITHHVGVHEDLSKMQQLEEQFQQAQKMESIGTLVGGIAHDFNNILAAILGNLYLAKKLVKNNPPTIKKLNNIEQLGTHAAEMIQQLLTFARKDQVSMRPLSLNTFMKEAFKLASRSIPENIKSSCDICEETLVIIGDATQLQQILMNLLNNAHGALSESDNPIIQCSLKSFTPTPEFLQLHPEPKVERFAHICVQDNGSGIPDSIRKKIFEPFFTTKSVGEGSGLGLAMVYGAVQTHAGYIDLESTPGTNTAFHIYIPLASINSIEPDSLQDEIIQGKGETILLADDDPDMRTVTCEVLQSLNYTVIQAQDGQQALELFQQHDAKIDMILTDIVMPNMGGHEMATHAREIKNDIPIVFASGYDKKQAFDAENALSQSTFLQKPFTLEALSQSVHQLLNTEK